MCLDMVNAAIGEVVPLATKVDFWAHQKSFSIALTVVMLKGAATNLINKKTDRASKQMPALVLCDMQSFHIFRDRARNVQVQNHNVLPLDFSIHFKRQCTKP